MRHQRQVLTDSQSPRSAQGQARQVSAAATRACRRRRIVATGRRLRRQQGQQRPCCAHRLPFGRQEYLPLARDRHRIFRGRLRLCVTLMTAALTGPVTTLTAIPGVLQLAGAKVQLLDLPGARDVREAVGADQGRDHRRRERGQGERATGASTCALESDGRRSSPSPRPPTLS